jgi:hypothetical protein
MCQVHLPPCIASGNAPYIVGFHFIAFLASCKQHTTVHVVHAVQGAVCGMKGTRVLYGLSVCDDGSCPSVVCVSRHTPCLEFVVAPERCKCRSCYGLSFKNLLCTAAGTLKAATYAMCVRPSSCCLAVPNRVPLQLFTGFRHSVV